MEQARPLKSASVAPCFWANSDVLQWMKNSLPDLFNKYGGFFKTHGIRGKLCSSAGLVSGHIHSAPRTIFLTFDSLHVLYRELWTKPFENSLPVPSTFHIDAHILESTKQEGARLIHAFHLLGRTLFMLNDNLLLEMGILDAQDR